MSWRRLVSMRCWSPVGLSHSKLRFSVRASTCSAAILKWSRSSAGKSVHLHCKCDVTLGSQVPYLDVIDPALMSKIRMHPSILGCQNSRQSWLEDGWVGRA